MGAATGGCCSKYHGAIFSLDPVWFFRCNDRGTICSVTAEDYYRIRRLCQLCRDTIYCLEADGTCDALRLNLKGYAPKD